MQRKSPKDSGNVIFFIPLAIVIIALVVTAVYYLTQYQESSNGKDYSLIKDLKKPFNYGDGKEINKDVSTSHNGFNFDLFAELYANDSNSNIFISPTSIELALGMVLNGAKDETLKQMQETLYLNEFSLDDINQNNQDLIASLENIDPDVELSIANSIWMREGVSFKEEFLETNEKFYDAKLEVLDFTDETSVTEINNWVADATNSKIDSILNSIPEGMVMYLINAVYFNGPWTHSFDEKLTSEKDFYLASQKAPVKHKLMTITRDMQYYEDDLVQVVSLPYGKKENISMNVYLPKEQRGAWTNYETFVTSYLNSEELNEINESFEIKEGTLELPKFKTSYEVTLNSYLSKMGMPIAFTDSANFSGMSDFSLLISEVKHKTYVDVTEEGTEAAAVTSVGMALTSMPIEPPDTFYMKVNRPFFFTIRENKTGLILFMGYIKDPRN